MKSPFDDLQIEAAEVCEFFAVFARFEYAMKATRYCRGDRFGNAVPDWHSLKDSLGGAITETGDEDTDKAITYLVHEPPLVQKFIEERPEFREAQLDGDTMGAQAIEAAKRVRNNIFHGGKHTPHSPPERDAKLVQAARAVLEVCLLADAELKSEFEHQLV